jgi:hypothetical protein
LELIGFGYLISFLFLLKLEISFPNSRVLFDESQEEELFSSFFGYIILFR